MHIFRYNVNGQWQRYNDNDNIVFTAFSFARTQSIAIRNVTEKKRNEI